VQSDPANVDTDGDGLMDRVDPFPNSSVPFTYKRSVYFLDQNGNVVSEVFEAIDANGKKAYWEVGTHTENDKAWSDVNSPWRDSAQYAAVYGEGSGTTTFSDNKDTVTGKNSNIETKSYTTKEGTQGGTASGGESGDSARLDKITDNTAKIAGNFDGIAEGLNKINNNLIDTNKAISGIGAAGAGADPGAKAVADAVKDLKEDGNDTDISGIGDGSGEAAAMQALTDATGATTLDDVPEQYREKTTQQQFNDRMDDLKNSDTMDVITGSGAEFSSPECSLSWSYGSHNIAFSLCDYSGILDAMGVVMVAMAGLQSLMIIFKRG